jgi:hypothetical protein
MMRRSPTRVGPAVVVGVMVLACAVGAQSREEPLIRRVVAPPSPEFTTYIEGELVQVSIPSNWRELPGSNAVTFAPDGAYGNAGAKSIFTHGLAMGLARNDKHNLRVTTDDFIASYVLFRSNPGRAVRYRHVTIGHRPALHAALSHVSEGAGEPEQIEIFTTLLRDGALFYVQAVTPRRQALDYARTFRRIVESIEIMDCDRHAAAEKEVPAVSTPSCAGATRSVAR